MKKSYYTQPSLLYYMWHLANKYIIDFQNVTVRLSREPVGEAAVHRLAVRATPEIRWSKGLKFDSSKGNST